MPTRRLGVGAAGLSQVPQLQRLLEGLRGGAPGGESPQCRQGDRGDRAHGALVQNPVPAHCALRPRDPLLLQEKLVARDRVDPLVHRRVQPLMLRVHASGHEYYFIVCPDHNILKSKYLYS